MSNLLAAAQLAAPFDTGLTLKSIIIERIPSGFMLTSRGTVSAHNVFLERGTRFSQKHKGWWSLGVTGTVAKILDSYYNNTLNSETINWKELAEKSKKFPAQNKRFIESKRR